MDRRKFLQQTALGALGVLAPMNLTAEVPERRVRRNLANLGRDEIGRLERAVARLKRNEEGVNHCRSWFAIAATHGHPYATATPGSGPFKLALPEPLPLLRLNDLSDPDATEQVWQDYWKSQHYEIADANSLLLFGQCEHNDDGSRYFAVWHRLYLFVVEEAIRSFGDEFSDFTLPYWDVLDDARLPSAFRNPASSLYSPFRSEVANSEVSLPALLKGDPMVPPRLAATQRAISESLRMTFHDQVHNLVGGAMGQPATAAWDPLFLVMHSNVDRLWWRWQSMDLSARSTEVAGDPFYRKSFSFLMPDPNGNGSQRMAFEVADFMNIGAIGVGHRYFRQPLAYAYEMPSSEPVWGDPEPGDEPDAQAWSSPGEPLVRNLMIQQGLKLQLILKPGGGKKARLILRQICLTDRGLRGGFYVVLKASSEHRENVRLGVISPFAMHDKARGLCGSGVWQMALRLSLPDSLYVGDQDTLLTISFEVVGRNREGELLQADSVGIEFDQ